MQPLHGAYPALLRYAKSSDVVTSVIDGRVVLHDGQPVFTPQAEIMADIARRAPAWRSRLAALGVETVIEFP